MSRPWRHGHCLRAPTGSPCPSASARTCRFGGRLAAMAQRQSNNTDPDSADEEVSASATASCAFGPAGKRTTISEIRLCVEDHFSEWSPGLHAQKSYNRRPGRLSAVFAPLAREALSEVSCQKTSGEMIRVADSIPTCVAKGQRALQGTAGLAGNSGPCRETWLRVDSPRSATAPRNVSPRSVPPFRARGLPFTAQGLHLVVERRPGQLPIPERAGLTLGSENDLRSWIVCNPSARVADHRGRCPLRRQGLLRRPAQKEARRCDTPPRSQPLIRISGIRGFRVR
jgi:hypothetical protein